MALAKGVSIALTVSVTDDPNNKSVTWTKVSGPADASVDSATGGGTARNTVGFVVLQATSISDTRKAKTIILTIQ